MTKFKLGFLKSSTSSAGKSFLVDNTSKSSCSGMPSPKFKRLFTLRRKRNNSQSQPLFGQGNHSASPPRAINPLAEVATASTIASSISSSSSKQLAESFDQSPPAGIQTSRETGSRLLHEITERVATIEALDSMEKYNQIFQESENLGRRKTTQDKLDLNSGINQHDNLTYSHPSSSSSIASKLAGSPSLAPCIARHEQEQLQIQFAVQRCKISKFHRVLEVLQRAARRVEADQSISQANIFRSLAPLATFLYIIGIGVLLLRQQRNRSSQTPEENTSVARMILLFFVGMALTLVFLRGMVKLVSVFGKTFCEVDLPEIFRKGECVDVDGRGKGEAELIFGGMFIWYIPFSTDTVETSIMQTHQKLDLWRSWRIWWLTNLPWSSRQRYRSVTNDSTLLTTTSLKHNQRWQWVWFVCYDLPVMHFSRSIEKMGSKRVDAMTHRWMTFFFWPCIWLLLSL